LQLQADTDQPADRASPHHVDSIHGLHRDSFASCAL
jgi:hypothetical protein